MPLFSRFLYHFSTFASGAVLGHIVFDRYFRLTKVEGPSMEPVLTPGDKILGVSPELWVAAFHYRLKFEALKRRLIPYFRGEKTDDDDEGGKQEDEEPDFLELCWNDRIVVCEMSPGLLYCKVAKIASSTRGGGDGDDDAAEARSADSLSLFGVNADESRDSREFGAVPLCAVRSVALAKVSNARTFEFVPFVFRNVKRDGAFLKK